MPITIGWSDIAIRLLCTMAAAALIGFDRGEHGRPAGLRTTMLVALAASIAMIQVNLLLPIAGKASNSFVVMDLMRLPLGILSGRDLLAAVRFCVAATCGRRHYRSDALVCDRHWFVLWRGVRSGWDSPGWLSE